MKPSGLSVPAHIEAQVNAIAENTNREPQAVLDDLLSSACAVELFRLIDELGADEREALSTDLVRGLEDARAGRVKPAGEVLARLGRAR